MFYHGLPAKWGNILAINLLAKLAVSNLKKEKLKHVNDFIGIENAGKITKEKLISLIRKISYGVTELAVHPGENISILSGSFRWNYSWDDELLALTDGTVQEEIKRNKIYLVNFSRIS